MTALITFLVCIAAWMPACGSFSDDCADGSGFWYNEKSHQECIGVTAGEHFFNDPAEAKDPADRQTILKINDIQKKIFEENKKISRSGAPYVKIVLLMPLTVSRAPGKNSAIPLKQVQHSLEGAYTAQRRANDTPAFEDPSKNKIQLLLANQGSRQDASDELIEEIIKVSEKKHPLVSVIGLGSSTSETETVVEKMGALRDQELIDRAGHHAIPMVSAITSADSLTQKEALWSVSPSNIQYVQALQHFLNGQKNDLLKSGIVVYDTNKDPYANTLYDAFKAHLSSYINFPDLSYTGNTVHTPTTPHLFSQVVLNICLAANDRKTPLDTVFYAGRVVDFEFFARALENRTCKKRPLTVLTAATGFAEAQRHRDVLDRGNVTVIYASSSDSAGWLKKVPGTPEDFAMFHTEYRRHAFDDSGLTDGMAILHHDALATAVMAARLATPAGGVPRLPDVAAQFNQLVLAYRVRGASGRLSFNKDAEGRAVERVIPLLQIGTATPVRIPKGLKPYRVTSP